MTPPLEIVVAKEADLDEVRVLLREYEVWTGVDLCFQGFEREMAELPGDYVAPSGILLVARLEGAIVGCVAARRLADDVCEMKRLYVRDAARGTGLGLALVDRVLAWCRASGYRRVVLDTLPVMERAQRMYERLGFREIAPYRPNPVAGVKYMSLELREERDGRDRGYPPSTVPSG